MQFFEDKRRIHINSNPKPELYDYSLIYFTNDLDVYIILA